MTSSSSPSKRSRRPTTTPSSPLHGVSVTVRRGEILALLGANGAGKTTTLKAVSNLLPAERGQVTAGTIRFEGARRPRATSPGDLVRAGLVQVLEGRHCFRTPHRRGEPGHRRPRPQRPPRRDHRAIWSASTAIFPRLGEKRRAIVRPDLRRRTADDGDRPGADVAAAPAGARRAVDGPRAADRPGHFPDAQKDLNRETEGLSILVAEQNSAVALRYADRATVLENGIAVLEGPAPELRSRADIKAFYLGEAALTV